MSTINNLLSNILLKADSNALAKKNSDTVSHLSLKSTLIDKNNNTSNNTMNSASVLSPDSNRIANELILNTLIASSVHRKLERNLKDQNMIKALGLMQTRFKNVFEGLLNTSRITDFDQTQNFRRIEQHHSKEYRFTDTEFRACDKSVYYSSTFKDWLTRQNRMNSNGEVIWKRAKNLVQNACFAVDENNPSILLSAHTINEANYKNYFHTTDLDQGSLGNCWFISAATGIIQNFALFKKVVPFDNTFDNDKYTGAFHFRFWMYGEWKDVIVDDYLPVDKYDRLIFCKNRDTPNEFWCALLEKAYAKLCGSYEALEGGFTTDA